MRIKFCRELYEWLAFGDSPSNYKKAAENLGIPEEDVDTELEKYTYVDEQLEDADVAEGWAEYLITFKYDNTLYGSRYYMYYDGPEYEPQIFKVTIATKPWYVPING